MLDTHNIFVMIDAIIDLAIVFAVGGCICLVAQILIIKTKLTPARILIIFLCLGIVLETLGVYRYIFDFAGTGISVPIIGFGAALAKGSIEYTAKYGWIGAFAGGLAQTAFGIGIAVFASYIITLCFSSSSKR